MSENNAQLCLCRFLIHKTKPDMYSHFGIFMSCSSAKKSTCVPQNGYSLAKQIQIIKMENY